MDSSSAMEVPASTGAIAAVKVLGREPAIQVFIILFKVSLGCWQGHIFFGWGWGEGFFC